ncbi:MAG: cysteine hydrolase [Defluviitaleaceae bacterium]|nr:cysteine hydrolase [Defluviitaleaceae bacterium]
MNKILIVVDMQNDFIDGSLGTQQAVAIVPNVVKRIADSQNELILFTQDTHPPNYLQTPEGKKLPVEHCIKDTHGWQISQPVITAWQNNSTKRTTDKIPDSIIKKPVFGSTALVRFLEEYCYTPPQEQQNLLTFDHDINVSFDYKIEIIGLCTDVCVVSNAIMLKNMLPTVQIAVNADCCAGVTPKSHIEALNTMAMCQIDILGDYKNE